METLNKVFDTNTPLDTYPLVLATDAIYDKWIRVFGLFENGLIPNMEGLVTGEKQDLKFISLHQFRCLRGLEDEEVEVLVDKIISGEVLLRKKKELSDLYSMEDYCRNLKDNNAILHGIKYYFETRFKVQGDIKYILKKFKISEKDMNQFIAWSSEYIKSYWNPSKYVINLPQAVISQLEIKRKIAEGMQLASRKAYDILELGDGLPSILTAIQVNTIYDVSLAVCDSANGVEGIPWTMEMYSKVINFTLSISSSNSLSIVFFVENGD